MTSSSISLQSRETLRNGLLRVVDELIDSLTNSQAHVSQNGEEDIHRVRTTIKRLRALLRLIRPAIDPAFFNRENARLRTAAALLSFARDAEVARGTLKTLPVSDEIDREAVKSVLSGLETRVEPAADFQGTIAEVNRHLEQTRLNFHRVKLRGSDREVLEAGIRAVYRQGRRRMKAAIKQGQDNAFHRWRIRAKNLYYELQFLESVSAKRVGQIVSRLSELEDQIGHDHDAAVLRAWLKKQPETFGGDETVHRVVTCLDSQTRELRQKVVPLGRKIWRLNPRRFAQKIVRHWSKR
jgi:CHAD domain-containing protein